MTRRILVIDDQDSVHILLAVALEATAGWETLVASSSLEGIAMAQTEQPDAILLDVLMPKVDGIAAFHQLQAEPTTQEIPVIFLTVKARADEKRELMALGSAGLITKPFEPSEISNQIKSLLHWSEEDLVTSASHSKTIQ